MGSPLRTMFWNKTIFFATTSFPSFWTGGGEKATRAGSRLYVAKTLPPEAQMQAWTTCGLARKALRISCADPESGKVRAAVLFDPIIFAGAIRSSVCEQRVVVRS